MDSRLRGNDRGNDREELEYPTSPTIVVLKNLSSITLLRAPHCHDRFIQDDDVG
jgi:hypothetical protein